MSNLTAFRCSGCGASCLMPDTFSPVHFSGSLAHLSQGYCTVSCARVELNRLLVERAKAWHLYAVLGERL
jgi:hypothetical protein